MMEDFINALRQHITVNYNIIPISPPSSFKKWNINPSNLYSQSGTTKLKRDICQLMFFHSLYNKRASHVYHTPDDDKLNLINHICRTNNYPTLTHEELAHLCEPTSRISENVFSVYIPYLTHELYDVLKYENTLDQTHLNELEKEIQYIINNPKPFRDQFCFFSAQLHSLEITDFKPNTLTTISNNITTILNLHFFNRQGKEYLCELRFTYPLDFTPPPSELTHLCLKLHAKSTSTHPIIQNADSLKFIALYPLQNKLVKFYHDPMISQF